MKCLNDDRDFLEVLDKMEDRPLTKDELKKLKGNDDYTTDLEKILCFD